MGLDYRGEPYSHSVLNRQSMPMLPAVGGIADRMCGIPSSTYGQEGCRHGSLAFIDAQQMLASEEHAPDSQSAFESGSQVSEVERDILAELADPDFAHGYAEALEAWDLAIQLADIRKQAGMTQGQLAENVGTKQQNISRVENPAYHGHSLSLLRRIARALGLVVRITLIPVQQVINETQGAGLQQAPWSQFSRHYQSTHDERRHNVDDWLDMTPQRAQELQRYGKCPT